MRGMKRVIWDDLEPQLWLRSGRVHLVGGLKASSILIGWARGLAHGMTTLFNSSVFW